MRFIPAKLAPNLMGLFIMPVMIMGMPFIMLYQSMAYENPLFWAKWGDAVTGILPYAVPLAITATILSKLLIGLFTVKPATPNH